MCDVNVNYRFNLLEFVLMIPLCGFMVHHYGIKPLTSCHNITSRNAIESNLRSFTYQNIQWTKIRIPETILELKEPVPHSEPSQLALSWLQLLMFTVASSLSCGFPGYHQRCIIWFHSCVYVCIQYFAILECTLLENKLTTTTTIIHIIPVRARNCVAFITRNVCVFVRHVLHIIPCVLNGIINNKTCKGQDVHSPILF